MTKVAAVEGKETLKLTEWELANLHLPPVTTVTLYEGSAPVENLRSRITIMLEKNPWLTSRIVKKMISCRDDFLSDQRWISCRTKPTH